MNKFSFYITLIFITFISSNVFGGNYFGLFTSKDGKKWINRIKPVKIFDLTIKYDGAPINLYDLRGIIYSQ